MNTSPTRQLGKYQLKELLGKGAMAEVYKAYQPALDRHVAIKIIHPELASDPNFVHRFKHEAKTVANLHHPGIVQVYDFDHQQDTFYMVMQYVAGTNLQKHLHTLHRAGKSMSLSNVISLFERITRAVAYAHQEGVLHRDLKPANVLLDASQQPILADFGLSRIIGADRITSGAIIGTPTYMSPEQAAGDEGDARSDIYSLGVMLYEMTTGIPPFSADTPISIILKHLDETPLPPKELKADLPTSLDWIIQKALAKDPEKRFQSANELVEVLKETVIIETAQAAPPAPTDSRCPFRGLTYFDAEHADFYFGRERLMHQLVDNVIHLIAPRNGQQSAGMPSRFVAVLGASGSGKSSLVRAGLIPAIKRGAIENSETWVVGVMRPGRSPVTELGQQLALVINTCPESAAIEPDTVSADLLHDGRALHQTVQQAWQTEPAERRLLLIVDQFEEVFTLCRTDHERWRFIENLLYAAAVDHGRVVVVIAIRADFYHRCTAYPDLIRRISDQQVLVGSMNQTELKRAIEKPAQRVGLQFEPGLVDTILDDIAQEPGALPLLQHALLELWEQRQEQTLTIAAYRATGGVVHAIAQRADSLYTAMSAAEQAIVKRVMLRLTQPGEGTEDTRRRVRKRELFPVNNAEEPDYTDIVLHQLANARLIITDRDLATGDDMVDVAHEALIRGWGRLQYWIDNSRADLRVHRQLTEAASQWQQALKDASYLYQGARLAQAEEWAAANSADINNLEREFLESSQAAALAAEQEKELARQRELTQAQMLAEEQRQRAEVQTRAGRRLKWLVAGLASVLVIAGVIAFVAVQQWQRAQNQTAAAQYAQNIAEAERSRAEQQAQVALSRQLVAQANTLLTPQPDLAILLGMQAGKLAADTGQNPIFELSYSPALTSMLHGHQELTEDVAFSPDGQTLVSAAGDRTLILWDVARRAPRLPPLQGHTGNVTSVAFDPAGQFIASASRDGVIMFWDAATGHMLGRPITAHTGPITDIDIDPNGQTLASASEDGTARLWDIATGYALTPPLTGHDDIVKSVTFSPNGKILATAGSDRTIRLRNPQTGQPIGSPLAGHTNNINAIAFSPDGKILASASDDRSVILWDVAARRRLGSPLTGHTGAVSAVAFSPDGEFLASGSGDKTIHLWDVETGKPAAPPWHSLEWVLSLAFSPDGQTIASTGDHFPVLLWDVNAALYLLGHQHWVNSVAFDPQGRLLLSGSDDSTAIVWDVAGRKPASPAKHAHNQHVLAVAYSPTGDTMATASDDNSIQFWDAATDQPRGPLRIEHTNWISSLDFSPDGRRLASSSADQTIRLWDAASGQPIGNPLAGHSDVVLKVVFSPDGRRLASSSADQTIRLWDAASGQPIGAPLTSHNGWIWGLAFSPDGKILASSSDDDTIVFWDTATLEPIGSPLTGHTNDVWGLAFSPDGKVLASGSRDGTIILWDTATRQPLGPPLIGHNNWIWGIDFSPDNHTIASGGRDGDIILWQTTRESAVQRLCRVVNRNLTPAEWDQFLPDQPYQKICPELPADFTAITSISAGEPNEETEARRQEALVLMAQGSQAAQENPAEAAALFERALALNPKLAIDPQREAKFLTAEALITQAQEHAADNNLAEAEQKLKQAREINPALTFTPAQEARRLAAQSKVNQATQLILEEQVLSAIAAINAAQTLHPSVEIPTITWLQICRTGALNRQTAHAMPACEEAVKLAPYDGYTHDSRGIARALSGDFAGAIEDFKFFVQWFAADPRFPQIGLQRELWIQELENNTNPLTPEILSNLKTE